ANPANWTKTYPGGQDNRIPTGTLALQVGDTWDEAHPDPEKDRVFTWQLAMVIRPSLFMFSSVDRLGHDSLGNGVSKAGVDRVSLRPSWRGSHVVHQDDDDRGVAPRAADRRLLPDGQPGTFDTYHAAVARELESLMN
ncbi:MAG: hypothetical protein QOD39_5032, partial [Mycobacterium sp.]|nr:hypothetical protein [Mycobacterium sp.]